MTDVSANVLQGKKKMKKMGTELEKDTDGDFSRDSMLGAASEVRVGQEMNTANSLYNLPSSYSLCKSPQREASFKYIPQWLYSNGKPCLDHPLRSTSYEAGA
jgi:hypothetical protein